MEASAAKALTYAQVLAELSSDRPFANGIPDVLTVTDFPRVFFVPSNALTYRVIASADEAALAMSDGGMPAIVLPAVVLSRMTVEKTLSCKYWIFGSNVDMRRAIFKARVDLSDATFSMIDAGEAVFGDTLDLTKARFEREANFWKATFEREVLLRFSRFHAMAYFSGVRAKGDFVMSAAEVRGKATFSSAVFMGDASFGETVFHAKTDISDVQFHRWANFSEAHFIAEADFIRTVFHARATFENVTFDTWADFKQMKLNGMFDMNVAVFKSGSHFSEMTVNAFARFNRITFYGYTGMQNIVIGEKGEIALSFSTFRERADISFRDGDIAGRINFRKVDFRERCEIPWGALSKHNARSLVVYTDGKPDMDRTVENLFILKRTYETLGRHDEEKQVYYLYKVFER
ncbi:MAG: pentapeptide repeat-containing protein, partial [Spirochaetota bacterium]